MLFLFPLPVFYQTLWFIRVLLLTVKNNLFIFITYKNGKYSIYFALFLSSVSSVQSLSHVQLCSPMDCSMPGFPVHHKLLKTAQTHVNWVSDTIQQSHPCHPLLFLPSIFPSIRVLSNESVLCIRWPKDWSFSMSPSNEYSGLIS